MFILKGVEPNYLVTNSSGSYCQTMCPVGFTKQVTTHVCVPCHPTCLNCGGTTDHECIDCARGFTFEVMSSKCLCTGGY